jgi:stage III sporulation protein AF
MSVLTEIVRNILVIIIMASFLELLLPEGAIRPFVRFAIGLFVLIAVLNPVLGYFFDDSNFQITWWEASGFFVVFDLSAKGYGFAIDCYGCVISAGLARVLGYG